jgi:hypothetical protein
MHSHLLCHVSCFVAFYQHSCVLHVLCQILNVHFAHQVASLQVCIYIFMHKKFYNKRQLAEVRIRRRSVIKMRAYLQAYLVYPTFFVQHNCFTFLLQA